MKKQLRHRFRKVGLVALAMAALVAVDGGQMGKAMAGTRVNIRLKTPHISVQYQNGPQRGRVHQPFVYRITRQDREIARQLAYRTGHRRIVLLDLRARGLGWKQIGRRLDIPRRIVRAAVRNAGHGHGMPHFAQGHRKCGTRRR